MKIARLKMGLCSNSSSNHALLIVPDAKAVGEVLPSGEGFGWDPFVLTSPAWKMRYLSAQIVDNLCGEIGTELACAVAKSITGVELPFDRRYDSDYVEGVDHQSRWKLPRRVGSRTLDMELLQALAEWMRRDRVVVRGGNDDAGGDIPFVPKSAQALPQLPTDQPGDPVYSRREGDWWTLFNTANGTKVRLSLKDDPAPYVCTAPDLVDLKITNKCRCVCRYCYQGSTDKGEHAYFDRLEVVAAALCDLGVFEAALGGGEPTEHPDFLRLVATLHDYGIVPNFATRSTAWMKDSKIVKGVIDAGSAVAFSVDYAGRVGDFLRQAGAVGFDERRGCLLLDEDHLAIQVVMGVVRREEFRSILHAAWNQDIRVTLLGFKRVGRGQVQKVEPYDWWLDEVLELRAMREKIGLNTACSISIDTVLAAESEPQLFKHKVSDITYLTKDGVESCYVDAVAGAVGPSSYEPSKMTPVDLRYGEGRKPVEDLIRAVRGLISKT